MAQIKLSKAQTEILNDLKKQIDEARKYSTVVEWLEGTQRWYKEHIGEAEVMLTKDDHNSKYWKDAFTERQNGIALCVANTRTLKKLEELGFIEIIKDGKSYVDVVKILNY